MSYDILWKVHALLMIISFLSMTVGILLFLLKKRSRKTFALHKRLGRTGAVSGLVSLLIAFLMVEFSGGSHLSSFHKILGALTGTFLLMTPLLMLTGKKAKSATRRRIHRYAGFTTALLMLINILSGLAMTGFPFY